MKKLSKKLYSFMPWTVLFLCLTITVISFFQSRRIINFQTRVQFIDHANNVEDRLRYSTQFYEGLLYSLRAVFAATHNFEYFEWEAFLKNNVLFERSPGIRAIRYAQIVRPDEIEKFEEEMRRQFPDFKLKVEKSAPEYCFLKYVTPVKGNETMVGYDHYSTEDRKKVLQEARDTGKPTTFLMSEVHSEKKPFSGFMTVIPIYRNKAPISSVEERRAALMGYVTAICDTKKFFASTWETAKKIGYLDLEVFLGGGAVKESLLFDGDKKLNTLGEEKARLHFKKKISVAEREWLLSFIALPGFAVHPFIYFLPWIVLLGGTMASFLIAAFFYTLVFSRERAEKIAERMTSDLRRNEKKLMEALENLKKAQDGMLEQEKLRALGQMTSGIAHDFNNSLTTIIGFTDLLLEKPEIKSNEKIARMLEAIQTAGRDSASLVKQMRDFYRPREPDEVLVPLDLNRVIEEAAELSKVRLEKQFYNQSLPFEVAVKAGDIPFIRGCASEIREALTNLIFNAADAMPQGGIIKISTFVENGYVVLDVKDNGSGMTEETRRRCLEPFFTTKGEKGSGLGLPMVYGTLQRHHGALDIRTAWGMGTSILLKFPAEEIQKKAG